MIENGPKKKEENYIAIKKAPERVVMLKQMYEEEFERAMSQDEDRASFRISPYKPGL